MATAAPASGALPDGSYLPNRAWATALGAAGGIAADAPTLAAWGYQLYGGHILTSETTRRMATPVAIGYGLGTQLTNTTVGHPGRVPSYTSLLTVIPTEKMSIAILLVGYIDIPALDQPLGEHPDRDADLNRQPCSGGAQTLPPGNDPGGQRRCADLRGFMGGERAPCELAQLMPVERLADRMVAVEAFCDAIGIPGHQVRRPGPCTQPSRRAWSGQSSSVVCTSGGSGTGEDRLIVSTSLTASAATRLFTRTVATGSDNHRAQPPARTVCHVTKRAGPARTGAS